MFVAVGLLLGSLIPLIDSAIRGLAPAFLIVINIGAKLVVATAAYSATAQRNGKLMIFVAIIAGIATALTIYYDFVAFSTWADHNCE
nr:unnamed protein product [Haemonchus contortus]